MQVDLRIDGGTVITLGPQREIILDGSVAVDGKRIVAVGKTTELKDKYPALKIIDARGKLVLPGLIDAHIHNTQSLARGLGDDVDLIPWCFDFIYPYEALLSDEDTYISGLLGCIEMIRTGTTCAVDPGGYRMDQVARAFQDIGIRGMVSWAGMDQWSKTRWLPDELPGKLSTEQTLEEEEKLFSQWNGAAGGRIRASYALRVESNVSEKLYKGIVDLASRDGALIQMHAAVTRSQVEYVREKTGMSTIHYLDSLGVLGPNWFLSHVSVLEPEEVEIIAEKGVRVCHNPGSSMHGGYGACAHGRIPELMEKGVLMGMGCDGTCANNSLDMFRTMWQAATIHKEVRLRADLVPPEKALEMATIEGARALGWDAEIGSIEPGKKADIIIVDCSKPNWVPMHEFSIIPNLVYSGDGDDVETVIIDGRIVMEERVITTVDVNEVLKEAQDRMEKILQKLPSRGKLRPRWPVK